MVVVLCAETNVEFLVFPDFQRIERTDDNELSDIELVSAVYSAIIDEQRILDVLLANKISVARAQIVEDIVQVIRDVDSSPSGKSRRLYDPPVSSLVKSSLGV